MSLINYLARKSKRAYQFYYYYSPIPVLSEGETIVFNAINAAILLAALYCSVTVLPHLILDLCELAYFYATGNLLSVNVVLSGILLGKRAWKKETTNEITT